MRLLMKIVVNLLYGDRLICSNSKATGNLSILDRKYNDGSSTRLATDKSVDL